MATKLLSYTDNKQIMSRDAKCYEENTTGREYSGRKRLVLRWSLKATWVIREPYGYLGKEPSRQKLKHTWVESSIKEASKTESPVSGRRGHRNKRLSLQGWATRVKQGGQTGAPAEQWGPQWLGLEGQQWGANRWQISYIFWRYRVWEKGKTKQKQVEGQRSHLLIDREEGKREERDR